MAGRLNGIRYFLTYSQVNDENLDLDHLADALLLTGPHWLEAAEEHHQDGGRHFHVVIVYKTRRQQAVSTYFNVAGFHPNIKAIRNGGKDLYHRRHYIRKEEKGTHDPSHKDEDCDYAGIPTVRGDVPPYSSTDAPERDDWGAIVEQSGSRAEFLDRVRSAFPKDFVLKYDAIEHYAQRFYNTPSEFVPKYTRDSFTVPAELDEWVANTFAEVCFCSGSLARTSLVY